MNLDVNICTHKGCNKKNIPDDEYDFELNVCHVCKEKFYNKFSLDELQKDMFETQKEYRARINSLAIKIVGTIKLMAYDSEKQMFESEVVLNKKIEKSLGPFVSKYKFNIKRKVAKGLFNKRQVYPLRAKVKLSGNDVVVKNYYIEDILLSQNKEMRLLSALTKKDFLADDLALVKDSGKYGLLDKTGKWVLEPIYDEIKSFNEKSVAKVIYEGRTGFFHSDGKWIQFPMYESIFKMEEYGIYEYTQNPPKGISGLSVGVGILDLSGHELESSINYKKIYNYKKGYYGGEYCLIAVAVGMYEKGQGIIKIGKGWWINPGICKNFQFTKNGEIIADIDAVFSRMLRKIRVLGPNQYKVIE